jgi:DNA gyrase subunit B
MPKKKTKTIKKKTVKKAVQKIAKKSAAKKQKPVKKSVSKKTAKTDYKAEQIQVLEGLAPVRKRPGMYIGGTGTEGLHHLIWEVVDNAIDEAMAGHADKITVELLEKDQVRVSDNGRGIPVDKHSQTKKSALETVLTILHAGAKFGGEGYKVSGGLHGVGVSVVNALSIWMRAEVRRDGKIYVQEYSKGKPFAAVKALREKTKETGTTIIFQPDSEIFKEIKFDWTTILNHFRQQAYLTKGVKISVTDSRQQTADSRQQTADNRASRYVFYFEGGIASYVKYLNREKEVKNDPPFYVEKTVDSISIEAAVQYYDGFKDHIFTFANNIHTIEGGMHLTGFKSALTRALNDYSRKQGFIKEKDKNLSSEDVYEGLAAVVSIKLKNPQFEGQTKTKLGNPEARTSVSSVLYEGLEEYFEKNPREARAIIEKCVLTAKARQAARAARETIIRKGALEGMMLPGKLADCSSKNSEETELYIVEGDSAGGSAKQGRDRTFQAILPLKGKILNVERARLDRMMTSQEIKALIIALGTGIGDQLDLEKLRYGRIIIMTDADVDGAHIRTLLLTLFYRHFEKLITDGHLYIAQPPLYKIQAGKKFQYAYTEEDRDEIISEFQKEIKARKKISGKVEKRGKKVELEEEEKKEKPARNGFAIGDAGGGIRVQQYKGLGEMNPVQLWDTTMDPENRIMKKVMIEDAEKADLVFETLMGPEVAPRKRFIQTYAKKVRNLDI